MHHSRVKVIAVEGVIGAGKNTLIERVIKIVDVTSDRLLILPVYEAVSEWQSTGLFAEFYKNPREWAYKFQTYVFSTRIGKLAKAYRQALEHVDAHTLNHAVIVSERTPWSDRALFKDMLVQSGMISSMENVAYEASFAAWEETTNHLKPDLVVWLCVEVDEALRRIKSRGRKDENVPRDYETDLAQQHAKVFGAGTFEGAPVLRVDGMRPYHTDDVVALDIASALTQCLNAVSQLQD